MPGKIDKAVDFLKSNKWMRILYLIAAIGFFSWIILSDQSCDYEKGKGISCDSKSKVSIDVKRGN